MKPLPNCLDCGTGLKRHHNKRCRYCYGKYISPLLSGERHYKYKDGRKKPCLTCGTIITAPYPRNCRSCYDKSRFGKSYPNLKNSGKTRFKKGLTPWNKGTVPYNERKRIASLNRRHAGGIRLTREILQLVYEDNIKKFGTLTCSYCFKRVELDKAQLDHILPVTKGGTNEYSNLAIACKSCNSSKRNFLLEEWQAKKGVQ